MIKRYSSPCQKFTVNIKKDGKHLSIIFDKYDPDRKRRYIDIEDNEIQKQIEASPDFRVYFRLDCIINERTVAKSSETKVTECPGLIEKEFESGMKARNWLNTEHGISASKLTNNYKIIDEASKLGFIIKILNMKQ